MRTTTRRRAALYLRQSLDRAEGIEAQRERCAGLAESRGWEIVATFNDNEVKASKDRGPDTEWGKMLPRIGKDFDVIVSVDLDRLIRSTKDLNTLIDLKAAVVTVDGEMDLTSADGEFRATMIASIARFETRRASERQTRHKAAKAARGEWHGGGIPYGYRLGKDKRLRPNRQEVKLISEAATRLLERGQTLHSIIVEWNNRGTRTRMSKTHADGAHWRQANLRSILLNRSMLGETKAGTVGWEPIIDEQTFDRLTALLTDPSRKIVHSPGRSGGKLSLGGGLTKCGLCGESLITHSRATGQGAGTSTATLACLARVHGPSEKHPRIERERMRNGERVKVMEDTGRVSIAHAVLEQLVFEEAIDAVKHPERWNQLMQQKSPKAENTLAELERQRADLYKQRDGIRRVIRLDESYTDREAKTEFARIDESLVAVNEQVNALLGRPMLNSIVQGDKLDEWRKWPVPDKRSFLRLLIDRIEVHPYPANTARMTPKYLKESEDEYQARKWNTLRAATRARMRIVWKWEA